MLPVLLRKASAHCDGLIHGDISFSDLECGGPDLNRKRIGNAEHLRGDGTICGRLTEGRIVVLDLIALTKIDTAVPDELLHRFQRRTRVLSRRASCRCLILPRASNALDAQSTVAPRDSNVAAAVSRKISSSSTSRTSIVLFYTLFQ